jgi:hypothetical protein
MLRKNTLILVAVFAVLVAAMLLLQRNKALNPTVPESDAPTQPPPVYLFEFTGERVTGVLVEGADGQVIELQKDAAGTWLLRQPPTLPEGTDQTPITSAVSQLGTVRVLNELAVPPALDALGLEQPTTTLTFTLDTGETVKVDVGASAPTGNGYYVRVNGASPKLVDKFLFDQLTGFLTTPPLLPTPVLTDTLFLTPALDLSTPVP